MVESSDNILLKKRKAIMPVFKQRGRLITESPCFTVKARGSLVACGTEKGKIFVLDTANCSNLDERKKLLAQAYYMNFPQNNIERQNSMVLSA